MAIIFDEPEGGLIAERIDGHQLISAPLLDFELANVCWKKCRRAPERLTEILAGYGLRRSLSIELEPVDHDEALALALETGLTAYDASYLWLARHLGADLVTLDKTLARVAAGSR